MDKIANAAQSGSDRFTIAEIADHDLVMAMDIGARARSPDQHANRIPGRASAICNRRAQKAAGAGDQDQVATADIQFRHPRDLTYDRWALKPDCTFPENASTAICGGS